MSEPGHDGQDAALQKRRYVLRCPVRGTPLVAIVADGLECKCKSCRGARHAFGWAFLQAIRQAIDDGRDPLSAEIIDLLRKRDI